jgi:Tfp pilus assembly protein PilF
MAELDLSEDFKKAMEHAKIYLDTVDKLAEVKQKLLDADENDEELRRAVEIAQKELDELATGRKMEKILR